MVALRLSEYLHSWCFDIPQNWFDNYYTTTFVLGALKTPNISLIPNNLKYFFFFKSCFWRFSFCPTFSITPPRSWLRLIHMTQVKHWHYITTMIIHVNILYPINGMIDLEAKILGKKLFLIFVYGIHFQNKGIRYENN